MFGELVVPIPIFFSKTLGIVIGVIDHDSNDASYLLEKIEISGGGESE